MVRRLDGQGTGTGPFGSWHRPHVGV